MRFSRSCYDKPHRCPGGNGGGIHSAMRDLCDGGYITYGMTREQLEHFEGRYPRAFHFGRCTKCDVIVWPLFTRWFDPGWLLWWASMKVGDMRRWRTFRR